MVNRSRKIMDILLPELEHFIRSYISNSKIKNVDLRDLNLETSLDLDLNLFDLDMDLFLTDFAQEFDVNYKEFDWKNYGYPKGNCIVLFFRSFFNYKYSWVKKIAHGMYRPRIKVRVLQQAIESGVLN